MGKFSIIDVLEEQDTQNERAAISNLFEVQGIAKIRRDDGGENADPVAQPIVPKLTTAANSKWIAVAVESDVSIFTVDGFCKHQTTISVKKDTIVCLAWMGETNLLAAFTTARELLIMSPPHGVILAMELPAGKAGDENTDSGLGTISCVIDGDCCCVNVCYNPGNVFSLICSHWSG